MFRYEDKEERQEIKLGDAQGTPSKYSRRLKRLSLGMHRKASCRGGPTADAKGWLKRGGGSRALVDSRGGVGMSGRGTLDIPRFGALRRDNTPSPAECSWMIDSTMSLLELYGGGRKLAKA